MTNYRDTLNLPETDFSMKAGLPRKEPDILNFWEKINLYKKIRQKYIGKETCMLTYGDGIADININSLVKFHKSHKKLITVTAVRPPARFGAIKIKDDKVISFKEKSKVDEGWINGGFFVMEPEFFKFIDGDSTYLEREPLEKAAREGELCAYKHNGFWQCMDTKRDKDNLEEIYAKGPPWI